MISISKLAEAIEHLEAAEVLMLDARRAFKVNSLEYDKLTYQADRASKAAEVTKTVLAHVEAGIYQATQHGVQRTAGICRVCGKPESAHVVNGHKYQERVGSR